MLNNAMGVIDERSTNAHYVATLAVVAW